MSFLCTVSNCGIERDVKIKNNGKEEYMRICGLLASKGILIAMLFTAAMAVAAEISWFTIDAGGISTGGNIQLVGVIGQTDTIRMTGGRLSLSGGYLPLPPRGDELFKDSFE